MAQGKRGFKNKKMASEAGKKGAQARNAQPDTSESMTDEDMPVGS